MSTSSPQGSSPQGASGSRGSEGRFANESSGKGPSGKGPAAEGPSAKATTHTVQLRKRGVLTLPKSLRETHGLEEGDPLHLVDAGGGTVVMTPMQPMVPELAEEIAAIRRAEGLSMDAVLQGLREQREQLTRERYGTPQRKREDQEVS